MFSEGELRAGLVYDESKLNRHRIQVVWVSPNEWTNGYRNGNIRFAFDWRRIVANRRAYWVEAITRYRPTACRILITDIDRDDLLRRYDPEVLDGPWQYSRVEDQHFWNGDYTLEIMIERDIKLDECIELAFVDHHSAMCAVDYRNCPDNLGTPHGSQGPRLLATLLGRSATVPSQIVWRHGREVTSVMQAVSFLRVRLLEIGRDAPAQGPVTFDTSPAVALTRAILAAYGRDDRESALALATMFASADDLGRSFEQLVPSIGDFTWP